MNLKLRNNRKKSKDNASGITLIALVVTIVVLLILAGISLNLVLGSNGIIAKVKDAKNQTEQDKINTETALNTLYDEMVAAEGGSSSGNDSDSTDKHSYTKNNITYSYIELSDGSLEITGLDFSNCEFSEGDYAEYGTMIVRVYYFKINLTNNILEIPSEINGKTVKKVNVSEVKLPSEDELGTIRTDIYASCFDGQPTIEFGDTIEEVNSLFGTTYRCFAASAGEIVLSNNLKVIGAQTFKSSAIPYNTADCIITVPSDSVESIGENAFLCLEGSTTVNFVNGLNLTIPEDKWGASTITINGVEQ